MELIRSSFPSLAFVAKINGRSESLLSAKQEVVMAEEEDLSFFYDASSNYCHLDAKVS